MPLVAAAVLPHPPLLVPELAGAAAAELDPLRAACADALAEVLAAASTVVLVGDGPVWGQPALGAVGSFRPYGVDVEARLPAAVRVGSRYGDQAGTPERAAPVTVGERDGLPEPAALNRLPLSLAVGAWLLAEVGERPGRLVAFAVPGSFGPRAAAAVGRVLARRAEPVGLVVLADLSARRTARAPGAFDPRAAGFDGAVLAAVRSGRLGDLLDLDPALAAELRFGGRVPLQVLAGACDGVAVTGRVLYDQAPYGVGYLVGVLTRR
jgi:hypothetical protein